MEADALAQSATPRGLVRLAAPMSFGLSQLAPLLPDFLTVFPEVSIDLHLSDALVDLIGEGFDVALRIATLPDSSLRARRLCPVRRLVVGAPAYFARRGRPTHPSHLAEHACLGYAYLATPDVWRFVNAAGEAASLRPAGPLRANNADALTAALLAGLGIAVQPDFVVDEALASGALQAVMGDWSMGDSFLHLVTPARRPAPGPGRGVGRLAKRIHSLESKCGKVLKFPDGHRVTTLPNEAIAACEPKKKPVAKLLSSSVVLPFVCARARVVSAVTILEVINKTKTYFEKQGIQFSGGSPTITPVVASASVEEEADGSSTWNLSGNWTRRH